MQINTKQNNHILHLFPVLTVAYMMTNDWFHEGMVGPDNYSQEPDPVTMPEGTPSTPPPEESLDVAGSIYDIDSEASEADSSSLIDEDQDYHSAMEFAILAFIQVYLMVAAWVFMLKLRVISAEYRFLGPDR